MPGLHRVCLLVEGRGSRVTSGGSRVEKSSTISSEFFFNLKPGQNLKFPNKGRTIRKVIGGVGVGVGNFQLARTFFFAHCLCRNFFFRWTPLHEFFFQTNIALFSTVKSWFITYVFVLYKLFYTHNRSKDTGHFINAKSFRQCTHRKRGGSHLERTASLCIFSVPALWNS